LITFALGVALAAIFGAVLPRHSKWDRACSNKYKATVRMGSVSNSASTFVITRIQKSVETRQSWVSEERPFTRAEEEDTLYFDTMRTPGCCSNSEFAISYGSATAIDRQPVTSNAVLTNIPTPSFWAKERRAPRLRGCNAMLRVDLQPSGTAAIAEQVERYTEACPYMEDILDAARSITFQPALRNGVPVTQQVAIFYTLR